MTGKNFSPFPVLKTERLTLRQLLNSDDTEIFTLRSNDNVNKYLDRKPCSSITDAQQFITAIHENIQKNDSVYWAIILNGTEKLIGTICLFNFSPHNSTAETGYELLPDFQGKGIMQEAASTVIDYAFQQLRLHSIEAYTHSENQRSARLLDKLHFKKHSNDGEKFMIFKLKR
jgi:ribosomal-protein-alanine N-acetyltransferase